MEFIAQRTRSRKKTPYFDDDGNEISYDIFKCFPILLCELVFQHFDANELLEISTVSPQWNNLVGESKHAKKLKFVFNKVNEERFNNFFIHTLFALRTSQRMYQHIEFCGLYNLNYLENLSTIFEDGNRSWKSMSLKQCQYVHRERLIEILRIIEPSVAEVSIEKSGHPQPANADLDWTFPCLETLKCDGWTASYFVHCKNLTTFHLPMFERESTLEYIPKILVNNHNLQDLTTVANGSFFELSIKFKLQKLNIFFFEGGEPNPESVHSFLQPHALTLESLELNFKLNRSCLELILNMPRLSSLFADFIPSFDWRQPLPVSTTIKRFMSAHQICDDMLRALARSIPALESIETNYFNVSHFPENNIFPKITNFRAFKFREGFQEPSGSHFAALVTEKMRYYVDESTSDESS